jgi:tetratricopeptide (TPR) repeat protein
MPHSTRKNIPVTQRKQKQIVPPEYPARSLSLPLWAPFAVIVFTAILYSKAIHNGLTGLDDDFYITNNLLIRDFSAHGVKAIFTSFVAGNYHPLTMLVYLFEYKFFELDPAPYHLLNVMLHLANIWLVYKLTLRLSGRQVTAFVVCILFGVHPMRVESVAWASELKDVLYSFFYLLSLIAYLRYLAGGYKPKDYAGVLLLFIVSLLCKSAAVTLPVLLIAIDLYKGRKPGAKMFLEKIPLLALSLLFGVLALFSQKESGAYNGLMVSYGNINSFFLFTSGIAFYLIWLVAPVSLSIFHYFPPLHGGLLPWSYYLSLPVVLFAVWLAARKNQFRKEVIFGVSFFLIAISVMLQVISVGSALTAERYTYISYIGLFYIAGQVISVSVKKNKHKNISIAIFSIFIIAYSVQTWGRIDVWKDDHTLFNDLIDKNPDFYYGYWLRGNVEKREGNMEAALSDFSKSIALNPDYEDAYFNKGTVDNALGNIKGAIADYNMSIKLNPKQADSYNNRGWAYYQLGDEPSAMQDYNAAIALKPEYAEAYNNRGWAYDQAGDAKPALEDYTRAIAANPEYVKPFLNRASLKMKTGDIAGAIDDYSSLIKHHGDNNAAYLLRGKAYLALNNLKNACADWQTAQNLGNADAAGLIREYCK